jgi:diguanylate cyclase (GGDEF)-like protein
MTAPAISDSYSDGAAEPPIWSPPDPALAAAGIEGEFVVARVRLLAMALLLIAPTYSVLNEPEKPMHVTGFAVTVVGAIAAFFIWYALRRGRWRPWIGFASSTLDVSLVSFALVTFLMVSSPLQALNSNVTFEMYFLAVLATSLRYDARICIVVGAIAVMEYGALWAFAATKYDLHDPQYFGAAGPYSPVDLFTRLILLGISTLLAVTIVRRAQRLLYLAARDRLTGLYNRGHFDRTLAAAMEATTRDRQPLSLAILDIDHFKQINDMYGHALGDRALIEVANLVARAMRRTDMVARYGGEEFVILMPGTPRDSALIRLEALRQEVATSPIDLGENRKLIVNFSAGVAGTPADLMVISPKDLLSYADARLLAAKRAGRARCIGSDAFAEDPLILAS